MGLVYEGDPATETHWTGMNESPRVDVAAELRAAAAAGHGPVRIVRDWWGVRRGPGRMTLHEYLDHRLWDPGHGHDDRAAFVGRAGQAAMHAACMTPGWEAMADDKALFDVVARGAGMRVAETVALVDPLREARGVGLRGEREVAAWLRGPAPYPLFAKPTFGAFSLGVIAADSYDAGTDALVAGGRPPLPVTEAARRMAAEPHGYVVQRRLEPHPALGVANGAIATVRLLVLVGPDGAWIEAATLKLPMGGNVADNYWRPGNRMASVDIGTGAARAWVSGTGAVMETGGMDVVVPDWGTLVAEVRRAAPVMRGIRTQSWDVAPTTSGPVLMELNKGGDLSIGQMASGRGALTARYRAHLARNGMAGMG